MSTSDVWKRAFRVLFALVATLILGALPASADGPLRLVATVPVGSVSHDLDLQDDFMYVATDAGLTVVDISRLPGGAPVIRGSVQTNTANMGVKVRDRYAYLAGVTGGFRVVDISNPDAPVVVATRAAHYAYDVALKDNVAFVVSFAGEMYLFDITDPTNPAQFKVLGLPAWRTPGADPQGLASLNNYATQGNGKVSGVVVKGDVLLAAEWGYGRVYYYNVADPTSPVFRGTHFAPYILKVDVDLDRRVVYMLSAYYTPSGVYTVPLDRLAPDFASYHANCFQCGFLASTVPSVGLDQGGMALGEGGGYLVYGGGRNNGEFHVVDVGDPLAMTYAAATVPVGPHLVKLGAVMGARISGDLAFFSAGALGVQVYEFPGLSGGGGPPPPGTPPTVLVFTMNSGATSTTTRVVTLNNSVSGSPVEYRTGESSDLSGAPWLVYDNAPSFSLGGPNGTKQVHFQVRNAALLESQVISDTITLNEPVPTVTVFAINGGAASTASRTVTLNNTATNGATEYRASEAADFGDASWLPYAVAPSFELSPGNATKRVYFQTRNLAGLSPARSDTINLLEPSPVLSSMAINNGASSTTNQNVTLNNVASNGPTEYLASESATFAGASWLPYSAAPSFQLSPGTATKRVYLQLRNAAGAVSIVRSDTIVLHQ